MSAKDITRLRNLVNIIYANALFKNFNFEILCELSSSALHLQNFSEWINHQWEISRIPALNVQGAWQRRVGTTFRSTTYWQWNVILETELLDIDVGKADYEEKQDLLRTYSHEVCDVVKRSWII